MDNYYSPPPPKTEQNLDSSIQTLLNNWERRRRWQPLLRCWPAPVQPTAGGEWRSRLAAFLESTPVHLATLCLLLLDLAFTILDLSSSLLLTCTTSHHHLHNNKGGGGDHELFFHWAGLVILSVFSARSMALVLALGGSFFTSPGRVVDGAVVVGALMLELLVRSGGGAAGGLVVVVSLWRVVRVVESAFELSDEVIEAQIQDVTSRLEILRGENRRLLEAVAEKNRKIAELEEEMARFLCGCGMV